MFRHNRQIYFLLLWCSLFLVGCAINQNTPFNPNLVSTATSNIVEDLDSSPSHTPTPTKTTTLSPSLAPSFTLTLSPTLAPSLSPTSSKTPEPSKTITPSFTATPTGLQPGIYGAGGCARIPLTGIWWVDFCVISVEVQINQTMIFHVTWLPNVPGTHPKVTKRSDINNPDMYITDDLGNHYSFVALGGYADDSVVLASGETYYGSYVFPPAKPGAHNFAFHDSDNGITIENLTLDKPLIAIYEYIFQQNKLVVEYRDDLWAVDVDEMGNSILNYLLLDNCHLQESQTSEPTGKLKNTLDIGEFTFEIYGWLEDHWGIREYRIVDGPDGYLFQGSSMFIARVPLEKSLQCLNDLSGILSTLHPQE